MTHFLAPSGSSKTCWEKVNRIAVRSILKIISGTGIRRTLEAHYIYRIQNGKIVEQWGKGDLL